MHAGQKPFLKGCISSRWWTGPPEPPEGLPGLLCTEEPVQKPRRGADASHPGCAVPSTPAPPGVSCLSLPMLVRVAGDVSLTILLTRDCRKAAVTG